VPENLKSWQKVDLDMLRDGLYIFNSIHKVMRAERILKGAGVDARVVPVPRSLSSDCGLSIVFPWGQRENADIVLEGEGCPAEATFRQVGEGYTPVR
jgi:hypothetical protein